MRTDDAAPALFAMPGIELRLENRRLPPSSLESLVKVRVRRELGAPAQCELAWLDPAPETLDGLVAEPGTGLELSLDARGGVLFAGEVTAVEHDYGPDARYLLRVRGYDRLHRLRKRTRLRAHVLVTPESLARDLTSELGVEVRAAFNGPRFSHLIQHRESDLDLLVDVAARAGLYPILEGNVLVLDGLEGRGEPIHLERGAGLWDASFELNGEWACRSVTAHAWDPIAPQHRVATARRPRLGRSVQAEASPSRLGADPERHLLNARAADDESAGALAQAELDRRSAAEVTFRGLCAGDAELSPGRLVEVAGVHPQVAGRYVLTAVTHVLDAERGFVTELSTEPPPARRLVPGTIATLGVVTQVADPEGRGRARARLPAYGDVETDWMRAAAPGAGRDKGLVAAPDVDDEVLVLLSHADPACGLILGGLFGEHGPEDPGVVGDAVKRFSLSIGGHRIVLDEDAGTLRLENERGSRVELGRDGMSLHAKTDLVVEAPGHGLVLRAATVDFEKA